MMDLDFLIDSSPHIIIAGGLNSKHHSRFTINSKMLQDSSYRTTQTQDMTSLSPSLILLHTTPTTQNQEHPTISLTYSSPSYPTERYALKFTATYLQLNLSQLAFPRDPTCLENLVSVFINDIPQHNSNKTALFAYDTLFHTSSLIKHSGVISVFKRRSKSFDQPKSLKNESLF